MAAFNLEKDTLNNEYYRIVIYTSHYQQLVLMSISDNIPREIHPETDQFIRIEKGQAEIIINDSSHYLLKDGDSITVPAGTYHEVINRGNTPLKLYTIYSPPHHPPNTVERYKI